MMQVKSYKILFIKKDKNSGGVYLMFQKSRRISASLVALAMVMSISSTAFAKEVAPTVAKTHWASGIMQRWVDYGIIKGSGSGDLRPDASITRAEVATIINSTFGFVSKSDTQFSDVKTDSWYAAEMLKARAAGYYKGFPGNLSNANTKITRQDAAVIISNVFSINATDNKLLSGSFKDSKDIANYAFNAVNKLSSDGIIKGYSDGKFQPKSNITRAEFIAIMDKLAKVFNKAGLNGFSDISSNVIVNAASTELKNTKVDKNLYIAESVGNGGVTLDNVTVAGTVYLTGGKDTIKIADTTLNQLVVNSKNTKLLVTGKSKIKHLVLNTEASIVENPIVSDTYRFEKVTISSAIQRNQVINFNGNISEVNILSDGAITFENGSIEKLQVSLPKKSTKPTISIVSAIVKKLIVNNPVDLQVGSDAKVNLEINSDNVAINGKTASKGVAVVDKGTLKQTINESTVEIPAVPNDSKSSSSKGGSSSSGGSKGGSGSSGGGSGSGSKGGSGSSGGSYVPSNPETVIKKFTFSNDLQDWVKGNAVNAAFATPEIEQSKDLRDGALKINANITDIKSKQQLMVSVDKLQISKANAVTFDIFLDSSVLEKYGKCIIKPSIMLEPGKVEDSNGFNDKALENWERIKLGKDNKEYLKYTVKNVINAPKETKLTIVFESSGLSYTGPIYIDNVRISNFTGPVETAPASSPAPITNKEKISINDVDLSNVVLADPSATEQTISLLAYLKDVGSKYLLFGQKHATTEGLTTYGSTSGSESDVKNAVGASPAVYEWDFEDTKSIDLAKVIKAAYKKNGIISLTANMPNFAASSSSTDFVSSILPDGVNNKAYTAYLDNIAEFANNINIPIIFRPFNFTDKDDFWWEQCTPMQYIKLYRYTVDYLKNTKGVHNFLYCYSSSEVDSKESFFSRYPGEPYVDILGFNIYDNDFANADTETDNDCLEISNSEEAENKIVALTEIGPNTSFKVKNNTNKEWYSGIVDAFKPKEARISYAVVGANTSLNQFCVPYRNHFLFGNHEMLQDFVDFYNDESIAFGNSLDKVYEVNVTKVSKEPYLFISGPIEGETLTGEVKLTAKVYANDRVLKSVQCKISGKSPILLEQDKNNKDEYTCTFTPFYEDDDPASVDDLNIKVIVKYEDSSSSTNTSIVESSVLVEYKHTPPTPTPTPTPTPSTPSVTPTPSTPATPAPTPTEPKFKWPRF